MDDLSNIYDFFCPSPPSLKELASMEVALLLWRHEIQLHLTINDPVRRRYPRRKTSTRDPILRERYPRRKVVVRSVLPDLPSTVIPMIEEYERALTASIPKWLSYHIKTGIIELDVLNHFLDFVCDFDGTIDFRKTAKRFVVCDGIGDEVKFKMACEYCLEDDVLRIWPSVSSLMTTDELYYEEDFKLYYWICRLKNQPYDLDLDFYIDTPSIEEYIVRDMSPDLDACEWSSLEYFLGRSPPDIGLQHFMSNLFGRKSDNESLDIVFFRYILARLNEVELKTLVREKCYEMFSTLTHRVKYRYAKYYSFLALRLWDHIKNHITVDGFCRLVEHILKDQTENTEPNDETVFWCEVWTSAPDLMKRAAIRDVLLVVDSSFFVRKDTYNIGDRRSVSVLLAMLSDTPVQDRITFWNNHWETLICDIRINDLQNLMKLCFNDDGNQMNLFKNDVISKYHPAIRAHLENLFESEGRFKQLEESLVFFCPNKRVIKEIRLKLLQEDFFVSTEFVRNASSFNEFVDKAFEDIDLATEFKNKLLVVPELKAIRSLKECLAGCHFTKIIEFVDMFVMSDDIATRIKKDELEPFLELLLGSSDYKFLTVHSSVKFDDFEKFINWLFKSDNEIVAFKKELNINNLVRELMKRRKLVGDFFRREHRGLEDADWFFECFVPSWWSDMMVKRFLQWYFVTPKAFERFYKKHAHDPLFKRLLL